MITIYVIFNLGLNKINDLIQFKLGRVFDSVLSFRSNQVKRVDWVQLGALNQIYFMDYSRSDLNMILCNGQIQFALDGELAKFGLLGQIGSIWVQWVN